MSHLHSQNDGNDENPEIIAFCPQGFVGVSSVFKHGDKERLWKFITLDKISQFKPKIAILGAWYPGYELLIDFLPKETIKIIWITSSVAQMEMTPIEIQQCKLIEQLLISNKIQAVFYSGAGVNLSFQNQNKIIHAQYPLSTIAITNSLREIESKQIKSIGFFMPAHFRKNISNQYLAFNSLIKEYFHIHTNINLYFPSKQTPFSTYYDWLPENDYKIILQNMKTSLHCTWTESFSYGAAESIIYGTIPIISHTIADNLELGTEQHEITVDNIDNFNKIAEKIRYISSLSNQSYLELLTHLQEDLKKYSQKAKYYLTETLDAVKKS